MANMVPNLDAMDQEELMKFWKRFHRPRRKEAAELIGDRRKGYTNLASLIAGYACNKAVAMGCREKGDIQAAQVYELHCDMTYERIPEDLRW